MTILKLGKITQPVTDTLLIDADVTGAGAFAPPRFHDDGIDTKQVGGILSGKGAPPASVILPFGVAGAS